MNTCICNQCGTEIKINVQEEVIDHERNGKDIVEQFFICPECGKRYTIFICDSYMEKRIAGRKRLKKNPMRFDPRKDAILVNEMKKRFKKLKKKYNRE